ncbi:MAG: sigma-70 family RNA polymerase sigma factor [Bacteroidota bacterium]
MANLPATEVTQLLHAASAGDAGALDRLMPLVYDELRGLAHRVRSGQPYETVNTTALVHEAYLKLVRSPEVAWESRLHFFRVAARAMRQVLVNEAHRHLAQKRGGGQMPVTLHEEAYPQPIEATTLLDMDAALERLEQLSDRQARIVECRFFVGLTMDEIADAFNISSATVYREWRVARAWLARELQPA